MPRSASTLACPDSLKGVLPGVAAAAALADGFAAAGVRCDTLPLADGGEGTLDVIPGGRLVHHEVHDAFGRPRRAAVRVTESATIVEAAQAIPFDAERLDVLAASSRGLGELLARLEAQRLLVAVGGTATMDGGAGLLEELDELPCPTTVLCDVQTTLYDAPRVFGPQKGATPEQIELLERRLREDERLAPYAELPGSGAAGGLGAALASLGGELVPGASTILDLVGFDAAPYELVVTGEGSVDATTGRGKAPGEVVRRCAAAGVRCVVFGGRVVEPLPDAETVALSGEPERAEEDLRRLGERLGRELGE